MNILRQTILFALSLVVVPVAAYSTTLTDDDVVPLGFVKSISLPTIQNNVTLDKEGNIYVNNDTDAGAYLYKYSPDGILLNTYQLSTAAHSEQGITCAAVADGGTVYAIVHADYQHSWPMELVKVDQTTGNVTRISSPSWLGYGRCRQGMFIVGSDIYAGTSYESHDKHLVKMKTDGRLVWMAHIMGSGDYGDGRYHLAQDGKIYTSRGLI